MMSRTYVKLVRYFIILIITTCLLSMALFFLTMGAPMAKDFHRLLRKQAQYIGHLTQELLNKEASVEEVNRFLKMTSDSYETGSLLMTKDLEVISRIKGKEGIDIGITDEMVETIKKSGIFVQPSHGGKPMIYGLLISSEKNGNHYLFIYKTFSRLKRTFVFGLGLVCLCFFLILAIYPLSKSFTKPLIQLINAQKKIVEGDFDSTLDGQERNDELGDLLRGFLDMQKSVDAMIESRKALLADISHELRSPLSRLNIDAELIKDSGPSPDIAGYVSNIEYEIQYMDTLLKQLSEYSTLNLPKRQLAVKPMDITEFMEAVFKRYQPAVKKREFSFALQSSEIHSQLKADQTKLVQVLNNLLDNAMNACDPNGEIMLGSFENKKGSIHIFVSNTGPEIPLHLREKIFDPLFRVDPSRSRKTGGLGLGLAISKKIVEHHGGKIWCECENRVTVFTFSLKIS